MRPSVSTRRSSVRPINVLDLRDTSEIGGPGKTILETYRAIDATRFQVHLGVFLLDSEAESSPFIKAAREYGMPVHVIRSTHPYDPRLVWRVASLARSIGADIIHAHEAKSDVIAYLSSWLHRVPTMTTLHGWIGNSVKQRLLIAMDKHVVQRFDLVVAVSTQIMRDMNVAGMRDSRLQLMHNAIVVERYGRTGEGGYLQELTGRQLEGPVLGCVGRLSFEKGHADLIEAVGIVAARGGRATVVLAGDGPERRNLEAKADALQLRDQVFCVGYIPRPERLIEEIDLMVLPSHTEGLPNAALEALAMNVPVLATRVGGTPEVITDGETGRLVDAKSPAALANGIMDFLANRAEWKQMADRGRAMVERDFDFMRRTRKLETMYTDLASRRPS
jgi:glycosyltransferase involved in cell wall biosynthesis